MSEKRDEGVGYGKPPTHSRFRKGKSGNPTGREKGSRNFATDLDEVLKAKVPIKENGKLKKVTSQQAALRRLREKALMGDARALDRMLAFAQQRSEEKAAQSAERGLSKGEDAILQRYERDILARGTADGPGPGTGEVTDDG